MIPFFFLHLCCLPSSKKTAPSLFFSSQTWVLFFFFLFPFVSSRFFFIVLIVFSLSFHRYLVGGRTKKLPAGRYLKLFFCFWVSLEAKKLIGTPFRHFKTEVMVTECENTNMNANVCLLINCMFLLNRKIELTLIRNPFVWGWTLCIYEDI